eukprot:CAMPEP_0198218788 /NCGR_PEP_ID=MMETSP1445-20131203/71151_1 /TAXON_ID=36898 /ORGANISM="Pyramimonas sp., Strain CCMP2087" /LENGTH=69 /DNA_ID=CAMNT_0043895985 /DNA_START=150 /DNA_END=355 /DNA_ORIENTATION=-
MQQVTSHAAKRDLQMAQTPRSPMITRYTSDVSTMLCSTSTPRVKRVRAPSVLQRMGNASRAGAYGGGSG